MNKYLAKKIAENITNEQLKDMFETAKNNITDWTRVSSVNKNMTKGTAWNILAKDFDTSVDHHILAKTNMVREFGDHLPSEFVNQYNVNHKSKIAITPIHQEPIF